VWGVVCHGDPGLLASGAALGSHLLLMIASWAQAFCSSRDDTASLRSIGRFRRAFGSTCSSSSDIRTFTIRFAAMGMCSHLLSVFSRKPFSIQGDGDAIMAIAFSVHGWDTTVLTA